MGWGLLPTTTTTHTLDDDWTLEDNLDYEFIHREINTKYVGRVRVVRGFVTQLIAVCCFIRVHLEITDTGGETEYYDSLHTKVRNQYNDSTK